MNFRCRPGNRQVSNNGPPIIVTQLFSGVFLIRTGIFDYEENGVRAIKRRSAPVSFWDSRRYARVSCLSIEIASVTIDFNIIRTRHCYEIINFAVYS